MFTKVVVPWSEFEFSAVRSSGPGGQNVNKTNSCVVLKWNIEFSNVLSLEQKNILKRVAGEKINEEGYYQVRSENHRDQLSNKKACVEKLQSWVNSALRPPKKRIATRPTRSSQRKRIEGKKHNSEKKKTRAKVDT